jgi:hypothetical protein
MSRYKETEFESRMYKLVIAHRKIRGAQALMEDLMELEYETGDMEKAMVSLLELSIGGTNG